MGFTSLLYLLSLSISFGAAFKAAVYEHVQQGDPATEPEIDIIQKNLAKFAEATSNASLQGADIIVFPERGILSFNNDLVFAEDVPEPGAVNPCVQQSPCNSPSWPILSNLSCMARHNGIYLVANILDKKSCDAANMCGCSEGGWFYYNTNVAFDRNGTLVSRYHKNHLFGERRLTQPIPPEYAVFDTDFGVKVGMFICFDVLFKEASDLVTRFNIDVAVLSSWWFDQLHQGISVAVQQAWAIRHNVTLLASGIQKTSRASLGSGIYRGIRGPLLYTYSPDEKDKLLVADLHHHTPDDPRYQHDAAEVASRVLSSERATEYSAVKLEEPSGRVTLCKGRFCCTAEYATEQMNDPFFMLLNVGHEPTFVGINLGMEECLVARCDPGRGRLCGRFPYRSSTSFSRMELRANFSVPDVYPMVVSHQLPLTNVRHWRYSITSDNSAYLRIDEDNPPPEPILFTALVGRVFDNDIFPPRSGTLTPY